MHINLICPCCREQLFVTLSDVTDDVLAVKPVRPTSDELKACTCHQTAGHSLGCPLVMEKTDG